MNDSNNNHNPHREFITPDNVVTLFIDHQAAIMTGVGDMDPVRLRNNVIALAKIAKLHNLPTVLSDNMPEGFAGPMCRMYDRHLPNVSSAVGVTSWL